jgi:hypothetical protein
MNLPINIFICNSNKNILDETESSKRGNCFNLFRKVSFFRVSLLGNKKPYFTVIFINKNKKYMEKYYDQSSGIE